MFPEGTALLALAESIADGSTIDWDATEKGASAAERMVIRELRILSEVAGLHRSMPSGDAAPVAALAQRSGEAPAIGSWAHLTLVARLGGGASGEVYRAWDRDLEREVALKLLRGDASDEDLNDSQIAREGRLLARVRHPNVIMVHGVAVHDRRVGLWMELVRGVTLEQQLTHGTLSAREAALVGLDLCRALAAIHAAGLIHRDVKAQNVMREDGGRIVLMDLGTGRELHPVDPQEVPDLAGTPLYLAPEIFRGDPASERTDLYSLGVLLYHLVTGSYPVRASTVQALHEKHKKGLGVRLRDARANLPTAFVRVVDRAIAHDPSERYETAGALEAALLGALDAPAYGRISLTWWRQRARYVTAGRAGIALIAAAAVVAVTTFGVARWRRQPVPTVVAPASIRSIAVLPLVNLSGDPTQEYFADGMTDELIGTLGQLGGLRVISRTSIMQFKGSRKALPDIAKELHVDAVLESSFMLVPGSSADAKRVRINARLIHAGSDTQLWDRTFESVVEDLLSLQIAVAKAVAEGIDVRLTTKRSVSQVVQSRTNVAAQEAYLQGRYLLNNLSRENLIAARRYLERAVEIDSGYGRAYASLSRCYRFLDFYGAISRADAARLAIQTATTAVSIDPSQAEAQNMLAGAAFVYDWDWLTAERAYKLAIQLNPNDGFARSEYARFLMADERLDDALEQARLSQELDPLSGEASGVVALAFYYQRNYNRAITEGVRALQLDPNSSQQQLGLGRFYAGKGAFKEAIASLERASALSHGAPFIRAELARTHAAAGRAREANKLMERLTTSRDVDSGSPLPAQYRAYVYAAEGDKDRAFEWLTRAFDRREPNLLWAKVDPRLDPIRGDPRFATLLRRLSLK